jgi:hypothetical protein
MEFLTKLKTALEFDPFDFPEGLLGRDCSEDEETRAFHMLLRSQHGDIKRQLLEQNNDVFFNMPLNSYINTFIDIGFKLVYKEVFKSSSSGSEEELFCFWEKTRALLLVFDTYTIGKKHLNSGGFYFSWKPNKNNYYLHGCSMSYKGKYGDTIIGECDCREGVRFQIEEMDRNGKFVVPWIDRPFRWVASHEDKRKEGSSYPFKLLDSITEERIKKFPEEVRVLIPTKREG